MSLRNSAILVFLLLVACTPPATEEFNVTADNRSVDDVLPSVPQEPTIEDPPLPLANETAPPNATVVASGNLVEFYLAPLGQPYIKHHVREGRTTLYNISGIVVAVEPVIISRDGVILRINNVSSRTLEEKESARVGAFDLYIDDIYTR